MTVPESDGTQIDVVRVFTDQAGRFGNRLGIARAADVAGVDHQALAARAGYAETVVVDAPTGDRTRMRIYTPAVELPFAGHPTVGTGWWLSDQRTPVTVIEVPAGPVEVSGTDGITWVRARAEWAPKFEFHQFGSAEEMATLDPADFTSGAHYVWTWTDEKRGALRARMFAPAMGIAEDEATGAAAIALTALLRRSLNITQGRGSQMFTEWDSDGWVRLGGRTVADHPVVV
ncbi:PhzF family phenazine biosynthesis protein [Nocardia otitidiscaviarum]|uniref:PhzF family phenazine biosynthesis protein n=1 Tax=Nocardia otitidiscaviarum TaxID=1823 RepID=UPI0004A6F701|nr:PhzF family phenazine biosynthesis protein [Nocardia otitidiscaviarum]MBF6138294.1 PhzF family phenazine biosynthesis protein [Nocardia otitidiscaviarum]MBF6241864.1 PhzF family phenazine biosynthesis protein [Nocardia otitidiscaviarum]MBF6489051.1 PhzF family phenazine biosynthesis protein [Nocardia otitidiscaviarum]